MSSTAARANWLAQPLVPNVAGSTAERSSKLAACWQDRAKATKIGSDAVTLFQWPARDEVFDQPTKLTLDQGVPGGFLRCEALGGDQRAGEPVIICFNPILTETLAPAAPELAHAEG